MLGLNTRNLLGAQLVTPGARLAAAEEISIRPRPWRLAKAPFPLLRPQLREVREFDRALDFFLARRAFGKGQRAAQNACRVRHHVLVAHEMHRNVGLVEPARDMTAPARKLLPQLIVQP